MAIYKNISSKSIIRKIFRDLNPNTDNWIDDAIEWIGEALEHIGASTQLVKKTCIVDIKDYKGAMPADLYYINQVAINTSASAASMSNQLDIVRDELDNILEGGANSSAQLNQVNARLAVIENSFMESSNLTLLAYCTTNFPKNIHCENCVNELATGEDCYYVDDNMLKTSFPRGKVCLSYMAFPLDDDCFPMVPDDISFKEAMFWYVYKQMLLGGMPQTNNGINYLFADEKWRFYCTQARNQANYPDIDRYESFLDQWVRLIPNINRHAEGFAALGARESLDRSGNYGLRTHLGNTPRLNKATEFPQPSTTPKKKMTVVYWFENSNLLSAVSNIYQALPNPIVGEYTLNDNDYGVTRQNTYWELSNLSATTEVEYTFKITATGVGASEVTARVMLESTVVEEFNFVGADGNNEFSGSADINASAIDAGNISVQIMCDTILTDVKLLEGNIKIK
jgi:hypothetical protein